MSNSTRSRSPHSSHRSVRYLRMPDAVLRSAGPPERRPSAAGLERAIASIAGKSGPARATQANLTPPVRDRIFSGELRDITGAVLKHGPSRPIGRTASSTGSPTSPTGRRSHAPLVPPPTGPKPWLRSDVPASHRSEPPLHLETGAGRPWVKKSNEPASSNRADLPADVTPDRKPGLTEVVLIEAAELEGSSAELTHSNENVQWLVIEDAVVQNDVDSHPEESLQPELDTQRSAPEAKSAATPVTKTERAIKSAPLVSETRETTNTEIKAPAIPKNSPAAESPVHAEPSTIVPVEARAEIDSRTGYEEAQEQEEVVVFADPEPLFGLLHPDPIVDLPDFPEADPIFDVPEEVEQEQIVVLPSEPDPVQIVDLPEEALAKLFYKLEANDDRYVPGVIIEYEYEYIEDESMPDSSPSLVVRSTPEEQVFVEPPVSPTLKSDTTVVVTQDAADLHLVRNDANAPKEELYSDIIADIDRELSPQPNPVPGSESGAELDLDLGQDLEERIRAEIAVAPEASERLRILESRTDTSERSLDEFQEVLLDDSELADHLLDGTSAPDVQAKAVAETNPQSVQETISETERHTLRNRLERLWESTPAPPAINDSALLENLRRLHTVPQPQAADFEGLLAFLLEKTRADALGILLLDAAQMVYRPVLSSGFDQRTATNFYLGMDDPFLVGPPDFQILRKSHELNEHHHLKKRFASDFFHRMDGIYLVALHPYGVSGFLALVFHDLNLVTDHVLKSILPPVMKDALPALQRFASDIWETERLAPGGLDSFEDTSIVDQIYRLLKEVSCAGRDSIEVLHLHFPDLLQQPRWRVCLDEMADVLLARLQSDEKIIEATPERITLILKTTKAAQLVEIAERTAREHRLELRSRILVYPEHSRNFFNYIAPGL